MRPDLRDAITSVLLRLKRRFRSFPDRFRRSKLEFDLPRIMDSAKRAAGITELSDFSNIYVEGLTHLTDSLVADQNFDSFGRELVGRQVVGWAGNYAKFERDLQTYPEIRQVAVNRPLFIIGFGRTGSTLLHNLLALDKDARTPRLWELFWSSPPPRQDTFTSDPRIEAAQQFLRFLRLMAPQILDLHPMHSEAPDECHWMMRHSPHMLLRFEAPGYWNWLKSLQVQPLRRLYEHYRLQVQHLQLFCPGQHWLSKSLVHQFFYPVLFDVFPDARVVRLHREPRTCIPSLASLASKLRGIYYRRVDRKQLGQFMIDWFNVGAQRAIEIDARGYHDRFVDVTYENLVADPHRTVQRIYSRLQYPYTPQFDRALQTHLSRTKDGGYRHLYSAADFGLSDSEIVAKTRPYLHWFDANVASAIENG